MLNSNAMLYIHSFMFAYMYAHIHSFIPPLPISGKDFKSLGSAWLSVKMMVFQEEWYNSVNTDQGLKWDKTLQVV